MKVVVIFLSFFLAVQSCIKQEDCPYSFEIPAHISPKLVTYHVGDTITFDSEFHKEVFAYNVEGKGLREYDMTGAKWQPYFEVYRIDSTEETSVLQKYFLFLEDSEFDFSKFSNSLGGEYNFKNDSFSLIFKIIPLHAGTYLGNFGSDCFPGDRDQVDFPGKCSGSGFEAWVKMNAGGDNNIDLLKDSPNPHFSEWMLQKQEERFNRLGGYCFNVIE